MKNKTYAARPCEHICARRLPLCIAIAAALASGFATQAGAATTTTTVPAGTVVTKTANYVLGKLPADNDTLNVFGAGTQWNDLKGLEVGGEGSGTLNIRDAGKVTAQTLAIGAKGTVNLEGGSLEVTSGTIAKGGILNWVKGTLGITGEASLGTGLLAANITLDAGKTLRVSDRTDSAGRTTTGKFTISRGTSLTLDGGTLDVTTSAVQSGGVFNWIKGTLGFTGETSLGTGLLAANTTLDAGKTLQISDRPSTSQAGLVAGKLNIGTGNTLTLDGGSLQVSAGSINGGVFNWIKGTLGITGSAIIGEGLLAKTTTLDAGKTLNVDRNLSINGGSLTLDGGALTIQTGSILRGTFNWVQGMLGFSGDATAGTGLLPGNGNGNGNGTGTGTETIGTGKTLVVAGTLNDGSSGFILNGGTIQTGNWNLGLKSKWNTGTVAFTGDYELVASGSQPGERTNPLADLTTGKTLIVAKELSIASDATLTLDGGTLQVGSGVLLESHRAHVPPVGVFNWIKGTLGYTGDANIGAGLLASTTTVGAGKTLIVNGNLTNNKGTLNILDSGQVTAKALTIGAKGTLNLGEGAQLSTINGTTNNNAVTFNGNSTIQGNFTNNGRVIGTAGTLNFLNDVNGAGSYSGNIAFKAAFNPGNSPAAVSFNGGNAAFDTASVLNMEFFGSTPGAQYDQLVSINTLTFNGTLNLVFGHGYVPLAGSQFALFGFNNFNGSFGTAADGYSKITVAGYDRSKLDFSHLTTDGTLSVTAVPEPSTYAMLLSGLALIGTVARRRRSMKLTA